MSTPPDRRLAMSGKIYDPVFLCMIAAVVLAVGTSVVLRVVTSGAGPASARGASVPDNEDPQTPPPASPNRP